MKAKVVKPSEDSSEEQSVDEDSSAKNLESKHIFSYSQAELERKANGKKYSSCFGTDMYGRDFCRVMYGARVSMSVALFAAILVLSDQRLYGAISGYCGGKVDLPFMQFRRCWLSF